MRAEHDSGTYTPDGDLVITRIFPVPALLVFETWTKPEHLVRWWGPKGITMPFCRIDLRRGGVYHYCLLSPDGTEFWSKGVYHELVVPKRIVCTDFCSDREGNFVDPTCYGMTTGWPAEMLVTVTFTEVEGKTSLTLRHGPMPEGDDRSAAQQGWNECLDCLAEHLERSVPNYRRRNHRPYSSQATSNPTEKSPLS